MGFFDKVTKAVGDAVDKTKREADQFMRIQKIKGEIGEVERKIAGFTAEIAQVKADAGAKAIAMLRSGGLNAADLQPLADRVATLEQQIEAEQAVIAGKRADIEKIKAEDEQPAADAAPPAPPAVPEAPPATPPPVPEAAPLAPPPLPTEDNK
ncbi:MAG: hypothetical protein KBA95_07315 [Acidobacteria bacterium]|jgi:chromosome segregation ATPase|nr:hypothetical protein [Acidobacteriota bacterium]